MRAYVAVTDKDWYQFLEGRPDLDEVNFWQPGGNRVFRTLKAGEPFLFKLHYPDNAIVGGGFLAHASLVALGLPSRPRPICSADRPDRSLLATP